MRAGKRVRLRAIPQAPRVEDETPAIQIVVIVGELLEHRTLPPAPDDATSQHDAAQICFFFHPRGERRPAAVAGQPVAGIQAPVVDDDAVREPVERDVKAVGAAVANLGHAVEMDHQATGVVLEGHLSTAARVQVVPQGRDAGKSHQESGGGGTELVIAGDEGDVAVAVHEERRIRLVAESEWKGREDLLEAVAAQIEPARQKAVEDDVDSLNRGSRGHRHRREGGGVVGERVERFPRAVVQLLRSRQGREPSLPERPLHQPVRVDGITGTGSQAPEHIDAGERVGRVEGGGESAGDRGHRVVERRVEIAGDDIHSGEACHAVGVDHPPGDCSETREEVRRRVEKRQDPDVIGIRCVLAAPQEQSR